MMSLMMVVRVVRNVVLDDDFVDDDTDSGDLDDGGIEDHRG